jgi:hypothetical protein
MMPSSRLQSKAVVQLRQGVGWRKVECSFKQFERFCKGSEAQSTQSKEAQRARRMRLVADEGQQPVGRSGIVTCPVTSLRIGHSVFGSAQFIPLLVEIEYQRYNFNEKIVQNFGLRWSVPSSGARRGRIPLVNQTVG